MQDVLAAVGSAFGVSAEVLGILLVVYVVSKLVLDVIDRVRPDGSRAVAEELRRLREQLRLMQGRR